MRIRNLLIAPILLAPDMASARDIGTCAALYRQLNNAPQIIGNTAEMRRYSQHLSEINGDIRRHRIEMRRSGCGGSIVVFGGSANGGACDEMRDALGAMERERDALTADRENARQLWRSSDERNAILASIQSNGCLPSDVEEERKERLKVQGIELPKPEPYSGVTDLRTKDPKETKAANLPPPPPLERTYDPNKKVRIVGPQFLPDTSIDLANPKSTGPQPQQ
ncbi:hypothetical protein [Neorhizobium huautlense]|uniref:hypothetical protein n=1 Tax=Neorhizobium huautlense TaxID=67774 RepID=UPI000CF9F8B5|nr:hypothetical protein [Neorhizobium huautlense]